MPQVLGTPQGGGSAQVLESGPRPGLPRPRASVRYAALGDSVTVGLGDGVSMGAKSPDFAGRGFAAVLAPCLAPPDRLDFTNLATTGATIADVRASQLEAALAFRPTVASLVAGMNDVLDPRFDPSRAAADLAACVEALRGAGALVLLLRMRDPAPLLRVPRRLRRVLTARIEALNLAVDAARAGDPGVLVLDLASWRELYARSSWDVDRVHPSERGHRLLALGFADLLVGAGLAGVRMPLVPPASPGPGGLAHAWWLARVGLPWLVTRRGSILPGVAVLARALLPPSSRRPR